MKTQKEPWQLAQLVDMRTPAAVLEEVKRNFLIYYPVEAFLPVRRAFRDFNRLYDGLYPGYRSCNTRFHDKEHTTDALLAISRLIDGYNISKKPLPLRSVRIALIATIFHDAGYIQKKQDTQGTGAKYTVRHIDRSIQFMKAYFKKHGMSGADFECAKNIVRCTGFETKISAVKFRTPFERTLGLMLGTADLLGQMSSRTYLERLHYLYNEFKEGHIAGYTSAFNLLEKTLKFFEFTDARLEGELNGLYRYVLPHFKERYRINEDLYKMALERHVIHLQHLVTLNSKSYHRLLRRKM